MLPPIVGNDPGDENDARVDFGPDLDAVLDAVAAKTCEACGNWNAGTTVAWGIRLCGRASCLRMGLARWREAS